MNKRNNIEDMFEMLRYMRPHRSKPERRFIQHFISPLGVECDKYGNRYKRIGNAPIMYSAHTDTVHKKGGMQRIGIKGMEFVVPSKSDSNCLGADNTAGVWMLREMILAKKPGLYVFHRGEECGGLGSRWLSKNRPDLTKHIKAAIAFDRRGTSSIITHQIGGRCCSDDFGLSLADELKMGHKLDSGGSFTDTASYIDVIPECTNVSVGFYSEHSSRESLDMAYLDKLRTAMLGMNWEKLVIKRVAGTWEPKYKYYSGWTPDRKYWDNKATSYSGETRRWRMNGGKWEYWSEPCKCWMPDYYDQAGYSRPFTKSTKVEARDKPAGFLSDMRKKDDRQGELLPDGHELDDDDKPGRNRGFKSNREYMEHECMMKMIRENPFIVCTLLQDYGVTASDLADFVFQSGGDVPHQMLAGAEEEAGH